MSTVDEQVREMCSQQIGMLMLHGTVQQLRAAGQRLILRDDALVRCAWEPFDLPPRYVQLWFASGFTCGISPEGNVSS